MNANKEIKREGANATKIFDDRSVEADYRTLLPLLRPGLRVLDVGCGTGAISRGIAKYVGPTGQVVGIDNTERFIQSGKENHGSVPNLTLLHADLFDFDPEEKFDLIVAARVLQWLRNPLEALSRFRDLLKPQGQVSVLDYNHQDLEWQPAPPASMVHFYQTFLKWRAQAGMNNKIAEDLGDYFREQGFHDIEVLPADEVYKRGEPNFTAKLGIWAQVARSTQMVEEGYLAEEDRQQALAEYQDWIAQDATLMVMKLKEVRGRL